MVPGVTKPTLLLVDVQRNMLEPPYPVPSADQVGKTLTDLLTRARSAGSAVVHIRNNGSDDDPDAPGTPGWELIHPVADGEPVVDKATPDSFAGTDLDRHLEPRAPLVVVGMQSDYCVRATTLEALRRGHPVTVVRGAHATYDDGKPAAEISQEIEDQLAAAGAVVASPSDQLF
jgi:nicotinamidase-related amidase